jgi:Fe-S-cluster-containing hydrogenase component 2
VRIVVGDPEYCVACRDCVYACAFAHGGGLDREASRIVVSFSPEDRVGLPLTCLHCAEAWCMQVCPAGAITREATTGAVVIDGERCAGCKMCLLACPIGAVRFDAAAGVAVKCDLCGGDPACVRGCTVDVLQFCEPDEFVDARRGTLEAKLTAVYRKDEGTSS